MAHTSTNAFLDEPSTALRPCSRRRPRPRFLRNARAAVIHLLTLAAAVVVTAGAAGCTTPQRNSAAKPSSPSGPPVPFAGAPKVPNPLPESALAGDPCTDAMTPDRVVAAVGAAVPGKRAMPELEFLGPSCGWFNHDTQGSIGVSYTLTTHVGLSGVYENTRPRSLLFREIPPVQGFPAVVWAGSPGEERDLGECAATVGLTDRLSIDVFITLGSSKRRTADACELVPQIADLAVQSLLEHARS